VLTQLWKDDEMNGRTSRYGSPIERLVLYGLTCLLAVIPMIWGSALVRADEINLDFTCRTVCDWNFEKEITAYSRQLGVISSPGRKVVVDYSQDTLKDFFTALFPHYPKDKFKYTIIYNRENKDTYGCDMAVRLDDLSKNEVIYQIKYAVKPSIEFKDSEAYIECLEYVALNFGYMKEKVFSTTPPSTRELDINFSCETVCRKTFEKEVEDYIRKLSIPRLASRKVVVNYFVNVPGNSVNQFAYLNE
jgi:hypothetical protein